MNVAPPLPLAAALRTDCASPRRPPPPPACPTDFASSDRIFSISPCRKALPGWWLVVNPIIAGLSGDLRSTAALTVEVREIGDITRTERVRLRRKENEENSEDEESCSKCVHRCGCREGGAASPRAISQYLLWRCRQRQDHFASSILIGFDMTSSSATAQLASAELGEYRAL